MSPPALGSTVFYTLTKEVAKSQNRRRVDAASRHQYNSSTGVQSYQGSILVEGDIYPMIVTRVWKDDSVNGQVFLDGNDVIWVTSVKEGDEPGSFSLSDESELVDNPETPEDEEETTETPESHPLEVTQVETSVVDEPVKEPAVEEPAKEPATKTAAKKTAVKKTATKTASPTRSHR